MAIWAVWQQGETIGLQDVQIPFLLLMSGWVWSGFNNTRNDLR